MSKKKKDQKKSLSVNDIPVEKHPQQILNELDSSSFTELLNRCSTASYNRNRKSEGCLNEIIEEERISKISILEKALRDEDAEKERQKRENREKTSGEIDLRRPPSVSPTFIPPSRKTYAKGCFSAAADTMDFEYIDAGGDIELMEMGHLKDKPAPPVFFKGNEEKVCNEYWDGDMVKEPNGERVTTISNPTYFENRHNFFTPRSDELRKSMLKTATGVMSVTSECLTDDSGSTGGEIVTNVNSFDYGLLPRLPLFPPLDVRYGNKGHQVANERNELTNPKVEEKKRKILQRKAKEERNSYVVPKPSDGDCMGELSIPEVIKFIGELDGTKTTKKFEDGRQERSRKKTSTQKDIHCVATIGNQQGKAPAAAPSNKPQNNTTSTPVAAKENKKSPNKKSRKGGNTGSGSNPAPRVAGRVSTEDGEEEFLSADEGVVSSNSDDPNVQALSASEVMMDGANYRADNDDLSCIENQITEEQEFITVESRDKKKKSTAPSQGQRTGSTGKVERRNQQRNEQQPRRNSMEDRVKPRPRPQAAVSLGDYFDEKKHESHAKAKIIPFKEAKKKQDRLESTADSEYMDAQDEMALPTSNQNGTSTPEKGFSYADAAKKSAEPSRENSPACLNNKNNDGSLTSDTPSPPLSVDDSPIAPITSASKPAESDAAVPVFMPNDDVKEDSAAGLSFFYEENAFTNNDEAPPSGEDGAFVLNLGGKRVKFAMGMAAPISLQPVDDRHRAMVDLMMNRWKLFMSQGPDPTYYAPNVQV